MIPYQAHFGYLSKTNSLFKIRQLFLEAFEIAFFLCNNLKESYGINKIVNIVQQIMPTAFVLETSYWIFFSSLGGSSLCICQRFNIPCEHKHFNSHWISLHPIKETHEFTVEPARGIIGIPISFYLDIIPMTNCLEVFVNLKINASSELNCGNTAHLSPAYIINIRYSLTSENVAAGNSLVHFIPHPSTHYLYGSIFPTLLENYTFLSPYGYMKYTPEIYTVDTNDIPRFTITTNYLKINESDQVNSYTNITNYFKLTAVNVSTQTSFPNLEEELLDLPTIVRSQVNYNSTEIFYDYPEDNINKAKAIRNDGRTMIRTEIGREICKSKIGVMCERNTDVLWQYDPLTNKSPEKRKDAAWIFSRVISPQQKNAPLDGFTEKQRGREDKSVLSYAGALKGEIRHYYDYPTFKNPYEH